MSAEPCTRRSGVPPTSWRRLQTPTANTPPTHRKLSAPFCCAYSTHGIPGDGMAFTASLLAFSRLPDLSRRRTHRRHDPDFRSPGVSGSHGRKGHVHQPVRPSTSRAVPRRNLPAWTPAGGDQKSTIADFIFSVAKAL